MKYLLKLSLVLTVGILFTSCGKTNKNTSSLTGWNFNDPNYGNFIKGNSFTGQKTPSGMVPVEGGSFTMGQVQDDVMFDWNTTPVRMHVRSFYMDEAEVTNQEYGLFLQYIKRVYPTDDPKYKHIYESVLPDTLVWRKGLGNTDLLSENYLRHPAFSAYPVVGVTWIQANQYCKWRTNAVNMKELMDRGVLKNVFNDKNDTINYVGKNAFDVDLYLTNPERLFGGDTAVYKRGLPVARQRGTPRPPRDSFTGRHITSADGILDQKFRLPTEVEWEYAAKAVVGNREYNNIRGKKKYAWAGKYTRSKSKGNRGDQLANYKQGKGNYSGLSGWSTDGSDIPIRIKSYPPNAFGLYDMSGNVAEWVADVYRPIIDSEASDFNYFRGNIFTKKLIDKDGKVVIVDETNIKYDTLPNGKVVPQNLPGAIKYIPITKEDVHMRRNYSAANNTNLRDGDQNSSHNYSADSVQFATGPRMYNSPIQKDNSGRFSKDYDDKKRTTLISDETRVYKGGSWNDREYWLDPAQRRYLPQYMATNYIGFRCAADMLGSASLKKRSPRNPKGK